MSSTNNQQPPKRVISLLGAATETLYRLGLGHHLVGRSHECDYPPDVLSLPCISRPRLDVNSSSKDIDTAVRQKAADGEPIYKLDDEVLRKDVGRFDLLIAQDHCRVCAITPRDLEQSQHIRAMTCSTGTNPLGLDKDIMNAAAVDVDVEADVTTRTSVSEKARQLILKPSTLQDCLEDINRIANAMGVPDRGITLRNTLQQRLDRVQHIVSTATTTTNAKKPRVALLEWCDPIMGCGYWIPELINLAGGQALHCPPPGGATPTLSLDTLIESKPDVIIFALCGFGLSRAASEIASSSMFRSIRNGGSRMEELREACGGNMYVVDGNYLVNRSGPRVVESCEAMCEAIHSELRGHFGHFGTDLLTTLDKALVMAEEGVQTGSRKVRPQPFNEVDKDVEEEGAKMSQDKDESASHSNVDGDDHQILKPRTILEGPGQVVAKQLTCLESGEIEIAFALNSIANQGRWCDSDRFAAVLRSHEDFRRLLVETASVGAVEEKDNVATVCVSLPPRKGESEVGGEAVRLLWTMIAEAQSGDDAMAWRTEKVGVAH